MHNMRANREIHNYTTQQHQSHERLERTRAHDRCRDPDDHDFPILAASSQFDDFEAAAIHALTPHALSHARKSRS